MADEKIARRRKAGQSHSVGSILSSETVSIHPLEDRRLLKIIGGDYVVTMDSESFVSSHQHEAFWFADSNMLRWSPSDSFSSGTVSIAKVLSLMGGAYSITADSSRFVSSQHEPFSFADSSIQLSAGSLLSSGGSYENTVDSTSFLSSQPDEPVWPSHASYLPQASSGLELEVKKLSVAPKMAAFSIEIDGRWSASEMACLLKTCEELYNVAWFIHPDTNHSRQFKDFIHDFMASGRGDVIAAVSALVALAILPVSEDRALQVARIQYGSKGKIEVLGIGSIIKELRRCLIDYFNFPAKAAILNEEVEQAKLETARQRFELARLIGSEQKIDESLNDREAVLAYFIVHQMVTGVGQLILCDKPEPQPDSPYYFQQTIDPPRFDEV